MQGPPRRNRDPIGPDRLAIRKVHGDRNLGGTIAGVKDAGCLVGDERAIGKRAFGGDIALRDRPSSASNGFHVGPRAPDTMPGGPAWFPARGPQRELFAAMRVGVAVQGAWGVGNNAARLRTAR